jgi:hypothetical protein
MSRERKRRSAMSRVLGSRNGRAAQAEARRNRLRFETLEPRLYLAAGPVISEFMADNKATLMNSFNAYEDWIEICNTGNESVTLDNWHLTDNRGALSEWTFADVLQPNQHVVLNPGAYLVVWASGRNTAVSTAKGLELHTNFNLDKDGDYLALVEPDGSTIASEYPDQSAYNYPQQYKDVSFGLGQNISTKTLVDPATPVRAYVPASGQDANAAGWNQAGFTPGAAWTSGTASGVGFDATQAPPLPSGSGPFYYGPF